MGTALSFADPIRELEMIMGYALLALSVVTGVLYFKSYRQSQGRLTLRVDFWLLLTAGLFVIGALLIVK